MDFIQHVINCTPPKLVPTPDETVGTESDVRKQKHSVGPQGRWFLKEKRWETHSDTGKKGVWQVADSLKRDTWTLCHVPVLILPEELALKLTLSDWVVRLL